MSEIPVTFMRIYSADLKPPEYDWVLAFNTYGGYAPCQFARYIKGEWEFYDTKDKTAHGPMAGDSYGRVHSNEITHWAELPWDLDEDDDDAELPEPYFERTDSIVLAETGSGEMRGKDANT